MPVILNSLFPEFVDNTFRMLSVVALPMALISIGGILDLSRIGGHFRYSMVAAVFKLVILPVTGYSFLRLFGVSAFAFKVGMLYFALPTSSALYVLSSQLGSDADLGAAAILISTVLSFVCLSAVILLFF